MTTNAEALRELKDRAIEMIEASDEFYLLAKIDEEHGSYLWPVLSQGGEEWFVDAFTELLQTFGFEVTGKYKQPAWGVGNAV